ncbi:hypothetical protein AMIS_21550 [Actinoplanes missouriensis 431]|uniref:Uncharacterized protein n=1 Tax=Actinoplanes missouriensis (strain ATCC 14538 / DSM 43046 / CBS 188.64 / JCM 3121 / NBRC 102363 / NCIMB 12654 / NRRL B-3342 / UNCC 431) TaxID=512565 RepID=I0H2Y8_ACTM4|nr:hypothetical protein [Actinoplanes missouriensis]BAL87375.1 hypothetical protein AMIS_21550 [Actinoplanes missouriensis 431]
MKETWTFDEVTDFYALMLSNLRISGATPDGATPIDKVAERCGVSSISLLRDCRADKVEHVNYGTARCMTPLQVSKFLTQYSRGGELGSPAVTPEVDEMAAARESSAKAQSRRGTKKAAA